MQKTLSPVSLPFQPISLLDFGFSFNLETKNLISLFSASFMAGAAADSCFSRLHLRSGIIVTSAHHPLTPPFTLKNFPLGMIHNINPWVRVDFPLPWEEPPSFLSETLVPEREKREWEGRQQNRFPVDPRWARPLAGEQQCRFQNHILPTLLVVWPCSWYAV